MPYVLRYQVNVDWMPAGAGLGMSSGVTGTDVGAPGMSVPTVKAQTLAFFNGQIPASTTFTNSDVSNLLTTMTNDLTAQMEVAAVQTRIQNFATGGS